MREIICPFDYMRMITGLQAGDSEPPPCDSVFPYAEFNVYAENSSEFSIIANAIWDCPSVNRGLYAQW